MGCDHALSRKIDRYSALDRSSRVLALTIHSQHMNASNKVLLLGLSLVLCTAACGNYHDVPEIPLEVEHEPQGWIPAGKTPAWTITGLPTQESSHYGTGYGGRSVCALVDAATNTHVCIGSNENLSHPSYLSRGSGASGGEGLEFAVAWVLDTIWTCYTVNADTTAGSILTYNKGTGRTCASTPAFVGVDSVRMARAFQAGERIDEQATWVPFGASLYIWWREHTYHELDGDLLIESERLLLLWADHADWRYLGFRFRVGGGFRYGWVAVAMDGIRARLQGIAIEREAR